MQSARLNLSFRVDANSQPGLETVSVSGELDQATAPELRDALSTSLGNAHGAVLVDLSECGFIDSTGLSLLVETKRRLDEENREFGVCCPDEDVRRLLELTGISQAVGLFTSREEAVAALGV
jgi:anti-sigma B factor antagonist